MKYNKFENKSTYLRMNKKYLLIGIAAIIICLYGCGTVTRTEEDVYTISERDTTSLYEAKNAPGNRDNGIVYPSSRTFKSYRYLLQRDSVVTRQYPDFIRMGIFESAGFFLAGDKAHSAGLGLFGVYPDFKQAAIKNQGQSGKLFIGGLYRLAIGEWRLRWFRDAENWTIGTSLLEVLAPDARVEKMLISTLPLYIRKRYYIREEIPYIAFTPSFGIGYYPSQYLNVSASLDVGSLGGLNMRLYVGFAAGSNSPTLAPQVRMSDSYGKSQTSIFPYTGLGVSVLDFLNLVPETYVEWKDHAHSSWNIGLIQVAALTSGSDKSIYASDTDTTSSDIVKGTMLRVGNASIALPIFDYKLYAGTSLFNFLALGKTEWGIGVLPIRLGYWQTLIADELSTEPFVEFNYYPSSFINIGNRLNLRITDMLNLNFIIGYASGSTTGGIGTDITDQFGNPGSFSRVYLGIGIGFLDRIFFPENLRYNKGK